MENGFEVFISFKNTDKNGMRTQDSVMAEELYYALKEKGIRGFYSNISISERGEHRFGKMIREAIEQCSIFVAVGTSIENFESEWVEYERESFHDEMMNGNKARARSAMFSYITRNVSTNKLPMELRRCQAFYKLEDIVSSICTRFQKENEVIHNFKPSTISIESLSPGTLVDGKYKIVNKVGQGGMSVVYLAMDIRLNKLCAVKAVRKLGVKNFEVVKQSLLAEIGMLKSFDHPNLPKIIDVIDIKESFVIIMDFIEGTPLSVVLQEQGAQSEKAVIEWAKQLCDVLGYLHTHNPPIIYRDLKPANIMLKPNGKLTLIDFGTARQYKEQNVADTTCLGTLGYAAPEQFGGMGQTDPRTDIYTLGVTLYHLVTGQNPAEPPYEIYPIRKINPQLSYGLEEIIGKCTRRNPDERYQSVDAIKTDLNNIDKIDAKNHRKEVIKTTISKILGKKRIPPQVESADKKSDQTLQFRIPSVYSPPASCGGSVSPITASPGSDDTNMSDIVKKSYLLNPSTVVLCNKAAICISTKHKANIGDRVNIYFATEASKSDIAKIISSNKGYTKVVTGNRLIDVNRDDVVKIRLFSDDLAFLSNEYEFSWENHIGQAFYEYFSFQITDVHKYEKACATVQLYVNREKVLDIPVNYS